MIGKFIVIEGLEGSGKSSATNCIVKTLREFGIYDTTLTREPGGTVLSEALRVFIKEGAGEEKISNLSELLMLYVARLQLINNVIKPALARGSWVIGDRHDLSTQAYQGGGRKIYSGLINTLRNLVLGNFRPDLTIYLDVSPIEGLKRVRARGNLDRIEKESLLFFNRTRKRYKLLAARNSRIIIIDANRSIEDVSSSVKLYLKKWILTQELMK